MGMARIRIKVMGILDVIIKAKDYWQLGMVQSRTMVLILILTETMALILPWTMPNCPWP